MDQSPRVEAAPMRSPVDRRTRRLRKGRSTMRHAAVALLSAFPVIAQAQADGKCIPLEGSTACPAFQSASISTQQALIDFYPFLQFVSDRASFDYQLSTYVQTSYVKDRYQGRFGCGGVNLSDTGNLYARWTKTVICNTMVQMSAKNCNLSEGASRPICAETCAEFAQSEAYLTADKDLCLTPNGDLNSLIRADFTTCALPEQALAGSCIGGADNEPDNCGYGNSTIGLCSYCSAGGTNSTDTCCYHSDAEKRCVGIKLPSITTTISLTTGAPSSTPTGTHGATNGHHGGGLSGGAIAGIVIGAVAGVALLAIILFFCTRRMKKRQGSQQGSIFNQPSPARQGPGMVQNNGGAPQGYEVLPGGRIARMSALEGHSSGSPTNRHGSPTARNAPGYLGGMGGGMGGGTGGSRKGDNTSSSDEYAENSEPEHANVLRPPPATTRRHGSLSSNSVLGSDGPQSPTSAGDFSSPLGVGSQQSEQLPFFKDYYSVDDIHPADKVAVLWAYQPRAADEFSLERGDMLKVVGIWDDGWATGLMVDERADEWEARRKAHRDSGVSNTSGARDASPPAGGEMKAFPLVCVCLPEHWRKTIEGDGSTETESTGPIAPSNAS